MMLYLLMIGIFIDPILRKLYPDTDPVMIFNGVILYYLGFDLLIRYLMQSLPTFAIESYLHCLEVARQVGDPYIAAYAANNLGSAWYDLGDYDLALEYSQESLAVRERIGDRAGMASCWDTLGLVYAARGQLQQAEEVHRGSLALKEEMGDTFQKANSLSNLAQVHYARGEFDDALTLSQEAVRLLQELGTQTFLPEACATAAEALLALGQVAEARRYAAMAVETARATTQRKYGAIATRVLGEVLAADPTSDPLEAGRLFERSIQALAALSARLEWARACRAYAHLLGQQGQQAQAAIYQEQAQRLFQEIGMPGLGE